MNPILKKFNARAEAIDSLLCVGLDPELAAIPASFKGSQFDFCRAIIDQTAPYTAAYKPNMAFWEAAGARGIEELQRTLDYLRANHPDILLICDAKRADIGNTSAAYAQAVFDVWQADAVTLHPYLGREALEPFLSRRDKACLILCRNSNPGAGEFQDLALNGKPLWQHVAHNVSQQWDTDGNCMLVVGATYPDEMRQIRAIAPDTTFLVPGIGAQGGDIAAVVSAGLDRHGKGLIISSSRAILFSKDPAAAARETRDAINAARQDAHAAA